MLNMPNFEVKLLKKKLNDNLTYIFCEIKHGLTMTSYFLKLKYQSKYSKHIYKATYVYVGLLDKDNFLVISNR